MPSLGRILRRKSADFGGLAGPKKQNKKTRFLPLNYSKKCPKNKGFCDQTVNMISTKIGYFLLDKSTGYDIIVVEMHWCGHKCPRIWICETPCKELSPQGVSHGSDEVSVREREGRPRERNSVLSTGGCGRRCHLGSRERGKQPAPRRARSRR